MNLNNVLISQYMISDYVSILPSINKLIHACSIKY